MERINLIDELSEPGFKVALFTTFSTGLVFFEKMILRNLLENNCSYIGLFIDQKNLIEAITKPNITELGKGYIVKGIETNQAFHPKVFLLLGETKAKVLIGSGNLTPAGFITNYELFNKFTYEEKVDIEGLAEIQSAFRLFQSLHQKQDNMLWQELFSKVKEFSYIGNGINRQSTLLFNHEISLQTQLNSLLPKKVKEIECFVPYFDQSLSVFTKWNELYKPDKIKIYLQDQNTNFPRYEDYEPNISLFKAVFLEDENKRYHGKVFRFIGENEEVMVYGSANCSRQAILNSFMNGGNAEAIVVESGYKGEFGSFFTNSISITDLPIPLPDSFRTMESEEPDDHQSGDERLQFIDGIANENQIIVKIKSSIPIEKIKLENEIGVLIYTSGSLFTYSFKKKDIQVSSIITLEGYFENKSILITGWLHDSRSLHNTFNNMNQSVYTNLPKDPYLEDYHNIMALLDDLHNRLILNEHDLEQSEQSRNRLNSIHEQAELGQTEVGVSDNKEDYYIGEEKIQMYGSIGSVDVIGSLISIMLNNFYRTTGDTVEITGKKTEEPILKRQSDEVPKDIRDQLQKRMRRFTNRFISGITSEQYLEIVDSDVLIKNLTIYSGFLFKLKQKLGENFLSGGELVDECLQIVNSIVKYSENNILDTSREDVRALLIQSLGTIYAREYYIINTYENFHSIRNERKKLGQLLKNIHQKIYPIGKEIGEIAKNVCQFTLQYIGLNVDVEKYERSFKELFPLIRFLDLENHIKEDNSLKFEKDPSIVEPTLLLEREIRLNPDFNLKQLRILSQMLTVEEWENETSFKIRWFNTNKDFPLRRFVLYYNQKKRVLKKKYVYRNGESMIEQKINVYKQNLIDAAEIGNLRIITEKFNKQ